MEKFNFKTQIDGTVDETLPSRPNISKIEMQFENERFLIDLHKDLSINENNIIESLIEHSGNYGWWSGIAALAKRKLREKRREVEERTVAMDLEARSSLQVDRIKVTEAGVKAYIQNDTRVKALRDKLIPLEDMVEFIEIVLRALEHKREMLREVSRFQCRERFNES